MKNHNIIKLSFFLVILLTGCREGLWNNPHDGDSSANVVYSSFAAPPKTLDPAQAYSADSYAIISQIYEPPLQYSYLTRPYTLISLSSADIPTVVKLDENGDEIPTDGTKSAAYTRYYIKIKPNQYYQDHPAFAKDNNGNYKYHNIKNNQGIFKSLADFPEQDTRELTAHDFVYEIKRLASPKLNSPILSIMQKHIVGLKEFSDELQKKWQINEYLDLRQSEIKGIDVIDKYNYSITIYGEYPQFMYWLAMPFFAPIPWEVDKFYSQPGMNENNLTFAWFPVGTGPFFLSKNDPNSQMILTKNKNFHGEKYPTIDKQDDNYKKFAKLQGKNLPMIDELRLSLEKENIPYWYKFMQGYYDRSTISSDNFDQAIQISPSGTMELTPTIKKQGISLETSVDPSIFYLGFNMLDDKVGGLSDKNKLLRQAISIAIDYEEYINIFLNGRGVVAQSNIPPGIFGSLKQDIEYNPYTYKKAGSVIKKQSIKRARYYLSQAGYPNGIDKKTNKPLILYLDSVGSGPNAKAQANWYRKQFRKLGIDLYVVNTSWNRFQERIRNGTTQLYLMGWNADYPDPENFLFLLYGPNGKVKHHGENASNFENKEFDDLFEEMRNLPNNETRAGIIKKMTDIIQDQSPWVWGFFPKTFVLNHSWNGPSKINPIANNSLKYQSVDGHLRNKLQQEWNKPNTTIFFIIGLLFAIILFPAVAKYKRSININQTKKF